MTPPMLIDSIQIGTINFEACLIKDENKREAFAVFYQKEIEPLILFQQDTKSEEVEIKLNTTVVKKIQALKSEYTVIRKKHLQKFKEFILNAEEVAKDMIFNKRKLIYVSDIKLIKHLEKEFLFQ